MSDSLCSKKEDIIYQKASFSFYAFSQGYNVSLLDCCSRIFSVKYRATFREGKKEGGELPPEPIQQTTLSLRVAAETQQTLMALQPRPPPPASSVPAIAMLGSPKYHTKFPKSLSPSVYFREKVFSTRLLLFFQTFFLQVKKKKGNFIASAEKS